MEKQEVADIIAKLVDGRKAVKGDGFGYAGELISLYKRAAQSMQQLLLKLEALPEDIVQVENNPRCMGKGEDNVLSCDCRDVFKALKGNAPVV